MRHISQEHLAAAAHKLDRAPTKVPFTIPNREKYFHPNDELVTPVFFPARDGYKFQRPRGYEEPERYRHIPRRLQKEMEEVRRVGAGWESEED